MEEPDVLVLWRRQLDSARWEAASGMIKDGAVGHAIEAVIPAETLVSGMQSSGPLLAQPKKGSGAKRWAGHMKLFLATDRSTILPDSQWKVPGQLPVS